LHEYSITEEIVNIVSKRAEEENLRNVTEITVVVGDRTGFIGDSIRLYFEVLSEGKICENAHIKIIPIKTQFKCNSCRKNYEKTKNFLCPFCNSEGKPTKIGTEFYIKEISGQKS
jgi:hydrogenase nickel incorporation protein HypA/HybF